jgi:murein DD-endopeptidase MepM/ murein hydrolase activator NlpD
MKRLTTGFIVMLLLCTPFLFVRAETAKQTEFVIVPGKPGPGDIAVITLKGVKGPVEGVFNGKTLYFNGMHDPQNSFQAILGIDLLTAPGDYILDIIAGGTRLHRTVTISKKKYPVQRLTLPRGMVELSPENDARAEREQKVMAAIWPRETARAWSGNFINPRSGRITTTFGVRRVINKIPKSSHTGVDVSAKEGDEVRAPNNGIAVLTDEQFYSGNSIVLDHGQGIYTMFFHLSKMLVTPGQEVRKGDVIGLVGSTGRSTGAHLHWGARIQGARVDPMELIHLRLE